MYPPSYGGGAAAVSILMSANARSLPILFVEGTCEVKLFAHHFPDCEPQVVSCEGHQGVKDALAVIVKWENKNEEKLKVLGFIDRDYGGISTIPRITSSKNRDIEIDLYSTPAAVRMLKEKASQVKCKCPRASLDDALAQLQILGLIRKFNAEKKCSWTINTLKLENFIGTSGDIDRSKLISAILSKNAVSKELASELETFIEDEEGTSPDAVVRGHDLSAVIGKWLRKKIGNRNKTETNWATIEENLRLASNFEELRKFTWAKKVDNLLNGFQK